MRVVPLPFHLLITHGWNVGGNNRSPMAEGLPQRCDKGLHAYEIVLQHVKDRSAHRMGCCNMQKTIQTL